MKQKILIALVIFAIGFIIRLSGSISNFPIADELLWLDRVETTAEHISNADFAKSTAHLKHPGIPATLAMVVGVKIKEWFIDDESRVFGYRLDYLAACRVANALISSLTPALLFLGFSGLIGSQVAFLAAALLVFDPIHIANSQVAHIDGVLTLCFLLTIIFYSYAVTSQKNIDYYLAGIAWGLAIAGKPTAGALVLCFLLFRLLSLLGIASDLKNKRILTWGDIWAFLIGHAVLLLLWTKLWRHKDKILSRLNLQNVIADDAYNIGLWLGDHLLVSGLVIAGLIGLVLYFRVSRPITSNFLLLIFILFALIFTLPVGAENLIRYWTFTGSLIKEVHTQWLFWQPPDYGYPELMLRRIPEIIVIGFILGIFALSREIAERKAQTPTLLCLILVLVLTSVLSVSSKQTIRYLLPAFPAIYLIAAVGFKFLVSFTSAKYHSYILFLPVLLQGVVCFDWQNNYASYFNIASGGIKSAQENRLKFHYSGEKEAIDYILANTKHIEEETMVGILGDRVELFNLSLHRQASTKDKKRIKFLRLANGIYPDFIVEVGIQEKHEKKIINLYGRNLTPGFTYKKSGTALVKVFKPPLISLPHEVELHPNHANTGGIRLFEGTKQIYRAERTSSSENALLVTPGNSKKGYMLFGYTFRLTPGKHKAVFNLALPNNFLDRSSDLSALVARLEFFGCSRFLTAGELSDEKFSTIELECEKDTLNRPMPNRLAVYWFGKVPLILKSVTVVE